MKTFLDRYGLALLTVCVVLIAAFLIGLGGEMGWRPMTLLTASVPELTNPGFECGFYEAGAGELQIGEGWGLWYDPDPSMHRPEYKPEMVGVGRGRVHSGTYAQKLFTTYSAHNGGVLQEVYDVTPGNWYRFSFWAYQWSSREDNPDVSVKDGKCSVIAGINPWGDTNALYRTTIWGQEALQVYDQWVRVEVVAQAWSPKIVVIAGQSCIWPVEHNDGYLDDAFLELANVGTVPTPVPQPTHTPYPTYTPEPTQPCPTSEPGTGFDYTEIERRVRSVVGTVVAEREPVHWPR